MLWVVTLLVHADGAVHPVVEQHDDGFGTVLGGGCELLAIHQKVAITGHRQHHAPGGDGRGNAGWHAVTHRAVGGRELGLEALGQARMLEEAVYPTGEVACAVGQHGICGQVLLQRGDDGGHVDVARQFLRRHICQVVGIAGLRPRRPRQADGSRQHLQ